MHRLTRRALSRAAACGAAALLVSCTGAPAAPSDGRRPESASASPSGRPAPPTARQDDGAELPLVAGQWGGGQHKEPPRHLDWARSVRPDPQADAGQHVRVAVAAAPAPSYASFMLHSTIDGSGIPDEDPRRQKVLACGAGIADPGCRITDGGNGSWTIEIVGTAPAGHPYRVLYVQWAPNRSGAEETWASWQLPLG
ncbi:hypothetical protein [Streptomyces sp. NRRL WC-3742]|uniref:hypothetical protein n=1 Tax=Streptomyces sp. NRRL WC-3742 TaxID=1463934 RepID=UPI0004CBBD5E|nr:hypothetical protein [Streptomyces sp. NRRL WC-3742]